VIPVVADTALISVAKADKSVVVTEALMDTADPTVPLALLLDKSKDTVPAATMLPSVTEVLAVAVTPVVPDAPLIRFLIS
jgi:hypothetical protein